MSSGYYGPSGGDPGGTYGGGAHRDAGRGGRHAYNDRGGRYGGHGGGGYGGRGTRGGPAPDSTFRVLTNCFQALSVSDKTAMWHRYFVQIKPKKRVKEGDRINGELPDPESINDAIESKVERFQRSLRDKGSNPTSRLVLRTLSQNLSKHGHVIATDGAATCYSPTKLFEGETETYGIICEDVAYSVLLSDAGSLDLSVLRETNIESSQVEKVKEIAQAMETILKDGLSAHMLTFGKNPKTFYFPDDFQRRFLEDGPRPARGQLPFEKYFNGGRNFSFAPFVGIAQSVRFCDGGKLVLTINNKVDFLFRQGQNGKNAATRGAKVPVLDVNAGTLAGIPLTGGPGTKISDLRVQANIESAMRKLAFNVEYTKGGGWVEHTRKRMKEKGKDEKDIDGYVHRRRTFRSKNQSMFQKDDNKKRILWGCSEETFEKDGKTFDVASYFKAMYDIDIRYPNMPIVATKRGFFPVEFLFQELSKVPNTNGQDFVSDVLAYNDRFAGRHRIDHIANMKNTAAKLQDNSNSLSLAGLLSRFAVKVDEDSVPVEARRLRAPILQFGANSNEENTHAGTWNLNRKTFKVCAPLMSYVVINLGSPRGMQADKFMDHLFRTMGKHGFKFQNNCDRFLPDLIVDGPTGPGTAELYRLFETAVNRAKTVFMSSRGPVMNIQGPNLGFRTTVLYTGVTSDEALAAGYSPEAEASIQESIVTRRYNSTEAPLYGIKCDRQAGTHWVVHKEYKNTALARIQFKLKRTGRWIDPMDIQNVNDIQEIGWKILGYDGPIASEDETMPNPTPAFKLEEWQIECPSLVVVYAAENQTAQYDCVKMLSDFQFGVQCQYIVQKKCTAQGDRIEQYCSNVALKVNTKMFSRTNNAVAWTLKEDLPWVGGANTKITLMMGYSCSYGQIRGKPATVVAGSVCLSHPMQMGQAAKIHTSDKREDVVDSGTLLSLVQDLARIFWLHADEIPTRILVFRDSGSDGSFDKIRGVELRAIRRAFGEMNALGTCKKGCEGQDPNCSECRPPKITFVVAQRDHNMCVVPFEDRDAVKNNVPSGTLVDSSITSYGASDDMFDFLLTPQGGLKGTSKPMYYRVITNENFVVDDDRNPNALTKAELYKLIYDMSFQYGTATKAPRKIPLLLNSDKLANRVIKFGGYMQHIEQSLVVDDNSGVVKREDDLGTIADGQIFASTSHGTFDSRVKNGWKPPFRPHIIA